MTSVFVAEWPDGQVTRMSIFGDFDLTRAVRVSWFAYDSRLKGAASRNVKIKSGRFIEQPDKVFNDIDVASYFANSQPSGVPESVPVPRRRSRS
jgi:hypothetical protein